MDDNELKIQLALGSIKWWELSKRQVEAIEDIETINLLYDLSQHDEADIFKWIESAEAYLYIQQRKLELTRNLI